ncbi:hypothetical protein SAMN05216559_2794 [Halomicrobium zhouii]|uniref:Uncharacterized protein n=1 Tax=Halomicrobium zhouii TaxID=767519 RepID=A0A1I6LJ93_9EURY|nr:hypothetical protein [Halomicrobium zhouii]SFS03506.1 hypothetical protein SAMN05216559_2794 [Halomicrobium zhouii]
MKGPGLFSMLQIVAGMSMAGPMYVLGFQMVMNGNAPGGLAFFALGLVAMFAPTYLVRKIGGPRTWIRRRLGRTGSGSDGEERFDPLKDR